MNENIQLNAFYLALLDHIPKLESSCVKNNWLLCVPQAAALPESHRISLRLLKMHVLIPTNHPGEYETLNPIISIKRIGDKDLESYRDLSPLSSK